MCSVYCELPDANASRWPAPVLDLLAEGGTEKQREVRLLGGGAVYVTSLCVLGGGAV